MIWVRAYALFWLCFCTYGTYRVLRRGTDGADKDEPSGEDIVRQLTMLRAVLSPAAIMALLFVLSLILAMMDAAGFLTALIFAPPRAWKPAFLLVAATAALLDHLKGVRLITSGVWNVVCREKSPAVLARYIDRFKPKPSWKGYATAYLKLAVAAYNVIWVCL